ncbi:MAG: hypothetical protein ACXVFT_02685 [Solirubrobacteraceae bacterium]
MAPSPLTILSPVPWWWALWIRGTWVVARLTSLVAVPLQRLSFIHAARWGLIGRWPADRAARRDRAAPRSLLFLTTFDGSAVQYIEAFVRVVPWRIMGLYGGARGFPGVRRSRPVERYIYTHSHEVGHFWCAHPEATVTMKRQALALHALHDEYLASGRSGRDWERFITRAQMLL